MSASNLALVAAEENLFVDDLNGMTWPALLTYFQNKEQPGSLPLSPGKERHVKQAQALLANEFEFNNEKFCLGDDFNWKINPSKDIEWLILLHKFYYFKELAGAYDFTHNEIYAQKWVGLIDSWIRQVPDGFIDSQVTGRRLQQWILSYHYFVTKWWSPTIRPPFLEQFLSSVHSQTHYLCGHLTPEGNHRTLELYAIFLVAVTFPELRAAAFFLEFSTQKLIENIRRDLLPDGVHRELSTDYHHTVLKNYLRFRELATINQIKLPVVCDDLLKRAIEFSYYVHKPDGLIPAINDGDCNSYLSLLKKANKYYPNPHIEYVISKGLDGQPPIKRSVGFEDSGYVVLRSDWAASPYEEAFYLFFDCASIGFGSHGHYDALNFEMAAFGHSLIVDPGRYTYNENSGDCVNWRKLFKSTSAHNTVVVDGLDQTPYRPGRPDDQEPVTTLKQFVSTTGFDFLHGQVISHQYPVVHERMIFFKHSEYWIVTDVLKTVGSHSYDLYFHLSNRAQDGTSYVSTETCHVVTSPNLLLVQPKLSETQLAVEQGYVSPEYGVKYPAPVIKFSIQQTDPANFYTVLYPYKDRAPSLEVTQVPVYREGRLCEESESAAIKINLRTATATYEDYYFLNHGLGNEKYDFADITCTGKALFLRRDENRRIVNLQGEGIQFVAVNSIVTLSNLNGLNTVSYQDRIIEFTDKSSQKRKVVTVLDTSKNGILYRGGI